MHHIFFPPRLDASVIQVIPYGYRGNALHRSVFQQFLLEEFQRPSRASFRRGGTRNGYEMRFFLVYKLGRLSWTWSIVESPLYSSLDVAFPYSLHRALRGSRMGSDVFVLDPFVGFKEDHGSLVYSGIVFSLRYDMLELNSLLVRELDDILFVMRRFVLFVHTPPVYHPTLCSTKLV